MYSSKTNFLKNQTNQKMKWKKHLKLRDEHINIYTKCYIKRFYFPHFNDTKKNKKKRYITM